MEMDLASVRVMASHGVNMENSVLGVDACITMNAFRIHLAYLMPSLIDYLTYKEFYGVTCSAGYSETPGFHALITPSAKSI
jgi:hypothetical protein